MTNKCFHDQDIRCENCTNTLKKGSRIPTPILPAELEEEFRDMCFCTAEPCDNCLQAIAYRKKLYSAGYLAGLQTAVSLLPEEEEVYGDWSEGRSDFREETLAAIEEEIKKVKGE